MWEEGKKDHDKEEDPRGEVETSRGAASILHRETVYHDAALEGKKHTATSQQCIPNTKAQGHGMILLPSLAGNG